MSEKQAEHFGITENHRQYFRSFSGKRNFAPHIDDSDWFHIESVRLNNGPPNFTADGDSISWIAGFASHQAILPSSDADGNSDRGNATIRTRQNRPCRGSPAP
jgi:hypothetical protein